MVLGLALALAMQAGEGPHPIHYFGLTDFTGPGLVCGAAFSFPLMRGETAVLTKSLLTVGTYNFKVRAGSFFIFESQYATTGGSIFLRTGLGEIYLKVDDGHSRWVYRDSAPGSTDVYGPAVDGDKPTQTFLRVRFGSPEDRQTCLKGLGSDERAEVPIL